MDVLNVNDDGETAMQTMQRPSGLTIRTRKATNRPNSCESQPCCPDLLAGTAQPPALELWRSDTPALHLMPTVQVKEEPQVFYYDSMDWAREDAHVPDVST